MYDEIIKSLTKNVDSSSKELLNIIQAVLQVYPMVVLANLTKNTYSMIRDEGFLCRDLVASGCYDDMIDDGVENIHPNYQKLFLEFFSRESLIKSYTNGSTEVYAELYQKDKQEKYHWVSTHAIRIEDESGDIIQICLNRVLDKVSQNKYIQRK